MAPPSPPPLVVIVAMAGQGHVNAAVDLARRLASFNVSSTIASTEACVASMEKQRFNAEGLPICLHGLAPHQKVGAVTAGEISDSLDGVDDLLKQTDALGPVLKNMLLKLQEEGRGAACVAYDFTMWWAGGVCRELRIPAYVFQPFSSSFFLYMANIPNLVSQGRLPLGPHTDLNDKSNVFTIPGLPDLHASEVPDISWDPNPICPFEFTMNCASRWRDASGVLLNTVHELDKDIIGRLMEIAPEMDFKTIGPVLPSSFLTGGQEVSGPDARAGLNEEERKCMEWLDEQPKASVLYVAFGTIVRLSEAQTEELAMGLEDSEQRFLWVVRKEANQQEEGETNRRVGPSGFEERVQRRGRLMWESAPQRTILRHPAVGGFLTHSGWNSILESLCQGVPMLCWPFFADQPLNAKWVAEVVGSGKLLKKKENTDIVSREEVTHMARDILTPSTPQRTAAARARAIACHAALDPAGSSMCNVKVFVDMLSKN